MLDAAARIPDLDVRERVRTTAVAEKQRIALGIVAGVGRPFHDLHQAAICVLAVTGGDTLGDNRALCVLADMDHLGAGVGLLLVVGHGDRVELADGIVPLQDTARILPGDRGTGLDLCPGNLRIPAHALAALGDEVVNAALAFLVARVPILDR